MVVVQEFVDLETPTGVMRTHILRPAAEDRYPGVLFYSEIFQVTEPVRRLAAVWRGVRLLRISDRLGSRCTQWDLQYKKFWNSMR